MPANLTPQYKEAEERYRQAETPEDKLNALEEMMAIIPKHKGTEKLRADIKRRISKLKDHNEKKSHGKRGIEYNVEKEGGGQVVLVGPPNAGKSQILSRLTHAQPYIGEFPFSTQKPLPGMMEYQDIKIQLVDMPPVTEEFTEPWMAAIVRNADAALLVLDTSDGMALDELENVLKVLDKFRVTLLGWGFDIPHSVEFEFKTIKKTIVVANKMDKSDSSGNLEIIRELISDRFPVISVSAETGEGLENLREQVFRMLDIVRVYTKVPGKPADMDAPYVLQRGTTVCELAETIHKEFSQKMKFARIWSENTFNGQMVSRDHVLEDRDVIELHV